MDLNISIGMTVIWMVPINTRRPTIITHAIQWLYRPITVYYYELLPLLPSATVFLAFATSDISPTLRHLLYFPAPILRHLLYLLAPILRYLSHLPAYLSPSGISPIGSDACLTLLHLSHSPAHLPFCSVSPCHEPLVADFSEPSLPQSACGLSGSRGVMLSLLSAWISWLLFSLCFCLAAYAFWFLLLAAYDFICCAAYAFCFPWLAAYAFLLSLVGRLCFSLLSLVGRLCFSLLCCVCFLLSLVGRVCLRSAKEIKKIPTENTDLR